MAVVVTRDGAPVSPALDDENAAFAWLLRHQGQSVDWARKYEGYDVRPATAGEVAAGVAWPREEADRLRSLALSNLRGDADHRAGHPDANEDSRHLTRENCRACVLEGYGADTDEGQKLLSPNYAAWPRIYVQAGRAVPAEWRPAFEAELDDENGSYRDALRRDVATWGVRFVDSLAAVAESVPESAEPPAGVKCPECATYYGVHQASCSQDEDGHWIVVGPDGQQLAGPFATEQEADDEAAAMMSDGESEGSASVAFVNA